MNKPTYIFKVPVAGDGAVGKTSLIVRYTQGTFTDTYKMTIGTSFAVKTVDLDSVMVKLQIWDLAGQPHFGGVRPLFYQGSTGVIYVFSVIDRSSFEHLVGWLEEARKNAGNVPGILIGNKTDLLDQREVSREEAEAYAAQAGLKYIETSAKLDENVGDAFQQVAVTIIKTKWPEWGEVVEELVPTEPEPVVPVEEPTHEEPIVIEAETPEATFPEPEIPEPIPVPMSEPSAEEAPIPLDEPTPIEEPTPTIESVELIEPIEPPVFEEPAITPAQPVSVETKSEEADIVVKHKAESSLVEFIGIDPHSLPDDDFEKRAVHAMNRLGVSEVGVLGTFLRSLIHQGQRDVVIESLESLQEER
ncbi:MAG: GTP-binding protein [Promethearchaeota archaeon]